MFPGVSSAPATSVLQPRDVALGCAALGWPVHPLVPRRKTPAGNCPDCPAGGHRPEGCGCIPNGRWCHGFHAATLDPDRIRRWWTHEPHFGVGVACGPADLVVVDVDSHADEVPHRDRLLPGIPIHPQVNLSGLASGFDTLALLAALRGQASPIEDSSTLRVRTPSGGMHVWYRRAAQQPAFRSSTGSSTKVALAWQVDIRAADSTILAPFTRTAAGTYEPLGGQLRPAALPDWLARELLRTGHGPRLPEPPAALAPAPRRKAASLSNASAVVRTVATALEDVAACASTPTGAGFTERLNRAAFTIGGLVGSGYLDATEATSQLQRAADFARPHQAAHNRRTIAGGLTAGALKPLHPQGRP